MRPNESPAAPSMGDPADATGAIDTPADAPTPPQPGGLLRPISPARIPGSRAARIERRRVAPGERPVAHTVPDDGERPPPLDWTELKLRPAGDEDEPYVEPLAMMSDEPLPAFRPGPYPDDDLPEYIEAVLEDDEDPAAGADSADLVPSNGIVPHEPSPAPAAAPSTGFEPTPSALASAPPLPPPSALFAAAAAAVTGPPAAPPADDDDGADSDGTEPDLALDVARTDLDHTELDVDETGPVVDGTYSDQTDVDQIDDGTGPDGDGSVVAGFDDDDQTIGMDDEPAVLELRQIAGLTAGINLELDHAGHEFAEGDRAVAFTITIDDKDRAVVVPGTVPVKLDTLPVEAPTLIGWGALDVGSARFIIRPRRDRQRAASWWDGQNGADQPETVIEVPATLGVQASFDPDPDPDRNRRRFRKRTEHPAPATETLNAESWEFIDRIRGARTDLADRERHLHPDPAELAARIRARTPDLGGRSPGDQLFAKVGVIVADMPWMPAFDDIRAIPDSLGPYLQPLMSLPSIPIAADLLVGPLGIVGSRAAATACARHIMLALHALSSRDLRLHVAAGPERAPVWDWAYELTTDGDIDHDIGFSVVIVDGMEHFNRFGLLHQDAIDHRVGVVILADSIDDLPAYSGTVLQVDRSGSGLLTNHLGHVISGTPVGVSNDHARRTADDLHTLALTRG